MTSSAAFAQGTKKDMFNPVTTSVTSQTIAPDARAAGMGDVGAALTLMSIPSIGTLQSILLIFLVQVSL